MNWKNFFFFSAVEPRGMYATCPGGTALFLRPLTSFAVSDRLRMRTVPLLYPLRLHRFHAVCQHRTESASPASKPSTHPAPAGPDSDGRNLPPSQIIFNSRQWYRDRGNPGIFCSTHSLSLSLVVDVAVASCQLETCRPPHQPHPN